MHPLPFPPPSLSLCGDNCAQHTHLHFEIAALVLANAGLDALVVVHEDGLALADLVHAVGPVVPGRERICRAGDYGQGRA